MRKTLIALLIVFLMKNAIAQERFEDCFKGILVRMDSLSKIGKPIAWDEWKNCILDKPMPDFKAATIFGDTIEMNKLKGKVVLINFWFIGCHPCIAEIPGLNKLVKKYKKKDVVFLAITWETVKSLQRDFFPNYKLDFKIIPNAKQIIDNVAASGFPTTYIINEQGIIKAAWNGGRTDDKAGDEYYEKAKSIIDRLLKVE